MPPLSRPHWQLDPLSAALLTMLLAGCGSQSPSPAGPPPGTGPGFDYAFGADAGAVDAGVAATPADVMAQDVPPTDAGPADAGPADAGPADAGPADAGPADAEPVDTGTPTDAGGDTGPDAGPPLSCGDGTCTKDQEDCKSCPQDCNACPVFCGDGACDMATEDCASCAADCGNCPTVCGNGKCELPTETYNTCPKDCPPTGTCDPLTSNGCVVTDQCYPTSAQPACAKAGSVANGGFCQLNTQCVKGYLCVGDKCKRICDHTGANQLVGCPQGEICDKLVYSSGKDVGWNVGQCIKVDACNLTTEVGCPIAETCVISPNGKVCIKAGAVTSGGSCKFANDCAKGLICIGDPGICKPKCHLKGGVPKCAVGTCSLVTIQEPGKPAQPAPDDLGVCG